MIVGLVGRSIAPDGKTYTMRAGKDEVARVFLEHKYTQVAFADPLKRVSRELWDFSREQLWGPSEARDAPDTRYPRSHGPWNYIASLRGVKCACCGLEAPDTLTGSDMFNCSVGYELPENLPQCYLTPRFALQRVGVEIGRGIDSMVWLRKTMRTAQTLLETGGPWPKYDPEYGLLKDSFVPRPNGVVLPDVRTKAEVEAVQAVGALILVTRQLNEVPSADSSHPTEAETRELPEASFDIVIHNDSTLQGLQEKVAAAIKQL